MKNKDAFSGCETVVLVSSYHIQRELFNPNG